MAATESVVGFVMQLVHGVKEGGTTTRQQQKLKWGGVPPSPAAATANIGRTRATSALHISRGTHPIAAADGATPPRRTGGMHASIFQIDERW